MVRSDEHPVYLGVGIGCSRFATTTEADAHATGGCVFCEVVPLGGGCQPKTNVTVLPLNVVPSPYRRVPGRVNVVAVAGPVLGVCDGGTSAVGIDVVVAGNIGLGVVAVLNHAVKTGVVPAVGFGTKEALEDELLWFLETCKRQHIGVVASVGFDSELTICDLTIERRVNPLVGVDAVTFKVIEEVEGIITVSGGLYTTPTIIHINVNIAVQAIWNLHPHIYWVSTQVFYPVFEFGLTVRPSKPYVVWEVLTVTLKVKVTT